MVLFTPGTKTVGALKRSVALMIFSSSLMTTPPDPAKIGDLWYDSKPDELTLYLYTGAEWVPAAPPVSLDGINATIEAALIVQNDLLNEQAVQNSQINALENTDPITCSS